MPVQPISPKEKENNAFNFRKNKYSNSSKKMDAVSEAMEHKQNVGGYLTERKKEYNYYDALMNPEADISPLEISSFENAEDKVEQI